MFLKLSSNIVGKLSPDITIYCLVGTELKERDIFENKDVIEIDIIEEKRKKTFVCLSDIKDEVDLNEVLNINKYSNFKKLVRITS